MDKIFTLLLLAFATTIIFAQPPCKEDINYLKQSFHKEKDNLHNWYHTEKDILHSDYEKTKYELKRNWERIKSEGFSEREKNELERSFEENKRKLERDFEHVKNDLEFDFQSRKKDLEIAFESDKRRLEQDCDNWKRGKDKEWERDDIGRGKPDWVGQGRDRNWDDDDDDDDRGQGRDKNWDDDDDDDDRVEGRGRDWDNDSENSIELKRFDTESEKSKEKVYDKEKGRKPRTTGTKNHETDYNFDETINPVSNTLPRHIFERLENNTNASYEKVQNKVKATWYKTKGPEIKVLHKYASIGSAVKIINPYNDGVVYAKVAGIISKDAENDGLVMEVSSNAMKLLKIYDEEFLVDCVYFVENVIRK